MLSKQKIMQEWRDFVQRRDAMTRAYLATAVDVQPAVLRHESPPPTPTAARAPASLTW
jgi:hypothetical protein